MSKPDDLPIDVVMDRRFALDAEIAILEGKHKAELEPLKGERLLCEQYLQEYMTDNNLQQLKTAAGMTFFQTADSVTVEDADAFFDYVFETGARELLNRAANKTTVKEYIEANRAVPPGIKYDSFRKLAWRRGKG